jgi:CRISPR-associated endoribonuclease Cas6
MLCEISSAPRLVDFNRSAPSSYELPVIPYVRLRMTLQAEEPARTPPYRGSMLRGAFGHALRRSVCVMGPAQACESCPLRQACAYARLFEPRVEGTPPPFLRGIDEAVRPYVFEPLEGSERLEPGETLRFDLLLFGRAIELQAYAWLAVKRMARGGLGAGRARFRLVRVEALDPNGPPRTLFAIGSPPSAAAAPSLVPPSTPLGPGPVVLRILTPLRIKVRNQLSPRPRFRTLVFSMLRRVLELAHFHVPDAAIDWSFHDRLDCADDVHVKAELRWQDWERWSNRQNAAIKLGGIVGRIVLKGDVAPFTELLRAAEIVHVGKGATFGLGRIRVEAG